MKCLNEVKKGQEIVIHDTREQRYFKMAQVTKVTTNEIEVRFQDGTTEKFNKITGVKIGGGFGKNTLKIKVMYDPKIKGSKVCKWDDLW